MNRDDTIDLLTAVAARDQRTVGEADIAAWSNDLDDVTLDEGLQATTAFHRSETALRRRIVAADIVVWVKWSRGQVVEQEHREAELGRARTAKALASWGEPREPMRALPAGGITGVDRSGGRGESASLVQLWVETVVVPCPMKPRGCGAEVDVRCTNPITELPTKIPHPARMRDADLSRTR